MADVEGCRLHAPPSLVVPAERTSGDAELAHSLESLSADLVGFDALWLLAPVSIVSPSRRAADDALAATFDSEAFWAFPVDESSGDVFAVSVSVDAFASLDRWREVQRACVDSGSELS